VTPDELVAYLTVLRDKAALAAPAAAKAMGEAYKDHLQNVTLVRSSHPPATKTPSPPGSPPALMTGTLRRSITCVQGPGGGTYGTALVSPHTIYARIQEYGGHIYPKRVRYLRWVEDGMVHYSKHVYIPERPYLRPAVRETVADGSLSRAAMASFIQSVFG
jgi:hypothetical protein